MALLYTSPSETYILIAVFLALFWRAIAIIFFQPYRNHFMRWYMSRFSRHHREARRLFIELLRKHQEYLDTAPDVNAGQYCFLEFVQADPQYRTLDHAEVEFTGKRRDAIESIDTLLDTQSIPSREMELFTAFFGSGIRLHKIWIVFSTQEDIHLQSISFFYHEESRRNPFLFPIEKKEFPREDNGGNRRRKHPFPRPPVRRMKLPISLSKAPSY